jgi:phage gpG-like protein
MTKVVVPSLQKSFKAGGRPKWIKLKPRYKKWKDKHYPGKPVLTRTGQAAQTVVKGIVVVTARKATLTSYSSYLPYLYRGNYPLAGPRDYLHLTGEDLAEIGRMSKAYVAKELKKAQKKQATRSVSRRKAKTRTKPKIRVVMGSWENPW